MSSSQIDFRNLTVVELGAGTGLCSLVAASLGADAMATDRNEETLRLVELAASRQGLEVRTQHFDIIGGVPLPSCHVLLSADCMYNAEVARNLARLLARAHQRGIKTIVADSVRIAREEFEDELSSLGVAYEVEDYRFTFTGSAVSFDEDVTRSALVSFFNFLPLEPAVAPGGSTLSQ
ncbi:hypothetical protein GUITHDRAFT_104904 [Guillardia theta CCMP2712]|uniref:Methyltransferase domain-containing protein n=1 Tax=Guillardia theta (strain CCMP2712) TaxID=905079 RepID=L1JLX3_GUITC|nr:hypothetical protein GUITHDRAFT_104904 [Guillardia theta CCMP2712]EKX49372.1 hypothetical protein GUITHDRAFT_104904 [Guillardia theta CCMP2712]|eukprot:XP_005836352.1 hypothetical protein GUITHDRAFT_104904 [Guillardia theta CCMP2712]